MKTSDGAANGVQLGDVGTVVMFNKDGDAIVQFDTHLENKDCIVSRETFFGAARRSTSADSIDALCGSFPRIEIRDKAGVGLELDDTTIGSEQGYDSNDDLVTWNSSEQNAREPFADVSLAPPPCPCNRSEPSCLAPRADALAARRSSLDVERHVEESPGSYVVVREQILVCDNPVPGFGNHMAWLFEGDEIQVLEAQVVPGVHRVRGRIEQGWITLRATDSGMLFARRM